MNSEDIARKYYARINIKLPDIKKIGIFLASISSLIFIRGFLDLGLQYFFIYAIYLTLDVGLTFKTLKSSLFFMSITAVLYLLMSFTRIPYIYSLGFMMPLNMYSSVTKYNEFRSFIALIIPPLVPLLIFFNSLNHYYYYVVYILAIAVVSYLYLKYMGRKGEKIMGMGLTSLTVLRPFVNSLMDRKPNYVEDFLNGVAKRSLVKVNIFNIGDKYLILPDIHYGIFDSVGSSRFVYDMESEVKDSIVLHGPGDHERDLPTRNESRIVVSKIREAIYSSDWSDQKFYGIHFWNSGRFQATTLKFSDVSLTFLERPNGGIDDLPFSLWNFSDMTGHYFVDTHNSVQVEEYTKEEIERLKKDSLKVRSDVEKPLYMGYAEGSLNSVCKGLCDQRVKFIAFSDGDKKVGIVYLYANNARPELTQKIKEELKDLYDRVIPVTPDDHSCSGTFFGFSKALYDPASLCDELVRLVKELGSIALASMKPVTNIRYKKLSIGGVKTLGKLLSAMTVALNEVGSVAMKTFWIPIITPYVLLLFIILFRFSLLHL
ncbi:MAG: DUF2070 family protein [Sulfolobaceae archaeon]|nr:DUF2070 family protein [Sulfolobaceae archaeon]